MTDEQIKDWLDKHAADLDPEELPFEEDRMKVTAQIVTNDGCWPVLNKPSNIKPFTKINSKEEFNRVVGDPTNWTVALSDSDLYNNWILPNAILLFGKTWFDRVKWRRTMHRSVLFPLFTDQERHDASLAGGFENVPCGKSRIAKISRKIASALETYFSGKWLEKTSTKPPGGYLVESIKNETIREIGYDLGFKLITLPACPYCLSCDNSYKTPLIRNLTRQYMCPRCQISSENLQLSIRNLTKSGDLEGAQDVEKLYKKVKSFAYFIGITCICPNNQCEGKFVPLTCVDYDSFDSSQYNLSGILKKYSVSKDLQSFKEPPEALNDFPLTCPFCDTNFTPRKAMKMRSGFKNKSGYFTGLPTISIWAKREINKLDDPLGKEMSKDTVIVAPSIDLSDKIVSQQHISLLIGELIIHAAKVNRKSPSGFMTWLFYKAAISWMKKYSHDANRYFFGWSSYYRDMTEKEMARYPGQTKRKMTTTQRGTEAAIHLSFFKEWLNVVEDNFTEITKVDYKIKDIKDISWFCRRPKFSGGPKSTFVAEIDERKQIANKTRIRSKTGSKYVPRIAKVCSIYNIQNSYKNYIKEVDTYEWQSIKLKQNSVLQPGNKVRVEVLVMPGHPSHAPIQRIIRLRSMTLQSIINRVLNEENTGISDSLFWSSWRNRVESAKSRVGKLEE
jgi:hypothetical protein